MTDYGAIRSVAGFDLASTEEGEYAHIFGSRKQPLCRRDITPDRPPAGSICDNCRHFAEKIGLLEVAERGGEA